MIEIYFATKSVVLVQRLFCWEFPGGKSHIATPSEADTERDAGSVAETHKKTHSDAHWTARTPARIQDIRTCLE